MYKGLIASGGASGLFGLFLIVTDLFVPLGVSVFGLPLFVAGVIMSLLGFYKKEPLPVQPEPGKRFCWYCVKQIPEAARDCPNCGLPQHDANS